MSGALALNLVLLVPGLDERTAFHALLSRRNKSLGVRGIRFLILKHTRRDAGCFREGPEILRSYHRSAEHCLVVLDHEGSGQESRSARDVEQDLRARLALAGWGSRAEVLVLEPEFEAWVWSDSPEVDRVLGWTGGAPRLREWMSDQGLWPQDAAKPPRPKESLRKVLHETSRRPTSDVFAELAASVGLQRCRDRAFGRLTEILRGWFPPDVAEADGMQAGHEGA